VCSWLSARLADITEYLGLSFLVEVLRLGLVGGGDFDFCEQRVVFLYYQPGNFVHVFLRAGPALRLELGSAPLNNRNYIIRVHGTYFLFFADPSAFPCPVTN
jgi:hypothetical protein